MTCKSKTVFQAIRSIPLVALAVFQSPTDENFYKYFNDKVKIVYDPASSISQLRVQAFSAEEAQKSMSTC